MPLIRFTKLIDEVLDHRKTQTIRLPRKNPIEVGDNLHVYALFKIGEAKVTIIERKLIDEIDEDDAILDGFRTREDCIHVLKQMHKGLTEDDEIDIITFCPGWSKMKILEEKLAPIVIADPEILNLLFGAEK